VLTAPPAAVVVTTCLVLQKLSNQVLIACKSAGALQLSGPHTALTPVVPASVLNAERRESVQKQLSSTVAMFGGVHAPCTSQRGPQRVAQAGRPEVKGTMSPSGEATALAAEPVSVCA
jgi:hypothetical protein